MLCECHARGLSERVRGDVVRVERRAGHGLVRDAGVGRVRVELLPPVATAVHLPELLRLRLGVREGEDVVAAAPERLRLPVEAVHHKAWVLLVPAAVHVGRGLEIALEDVVPGGIDVELVLELEGLSRDAIVITRPVHVQELGVWGMMRVRGHGEDGGLDL